MNGAGHKITTLAAIDALPEWQQSLWESEKMNLAVIYAMYGDTYSANKKELGPFVEFPDGSVPDFHMPKLRWKHHYDAAIDYWESPFYDKALCTLNYFSEKIADAIQAKDITSAARFAGTMAHYFQDNACPGHAVDDTDLEIVKDFLPPPEEMKHLPFHPMMEKSPPAFSLDGYQPKLYGTSIAEASNNFMNRLIEMNLNARKAIFPFFKAFYQNDDARVAELNLGICRFAAEVYADYLHTVTSIALERFSTNDLKSFESKFLSKALPYRQTAWAGGPYLQVGTGELRGVNLNDSNEGIPCELQYAIDEKSQVIPEALGATAYFEYEFKIPKGVYTTLSFDYGIHAQLGALYPITFEVYCNDRSIFCQTKDVDSLASSATISWPADGEKLQLITNVDERYSEQLINGRPIAATGHVIWGKPRLRKPLT